jgi:hypothetical protein
VAGQTAMHVAEVPSLHRDLISKYMTTPIGSIAGLPREDPNAASLVLNYVVIGQLRAMIFDIVIALKTREEVEMPGYEDGGSRSYISCGAMPLYRFWKVSIHLCFVISK